MTQVIEAPLGTLDKQEHVHFPWAHVEDFRRFFGLDKLLEYSRSRSTQTSNLFSRMLGLRSSNQDIQQQLQFFSAQTIATAQFAETYFDVRGTLSSYKNLDAAISAAYPDIALEQRREALSEYLYLNEVIDEPTLTAPMKINRFLGIIAHHAEDFWHGEHVDLFDMIAEVKSVAQIQFIASALLSAMPESNVPDTQYDAFIHVFRHQAKAVVPALRSYAKTLDDGASAIAVRARLQHLVNGLREMTA